VTHDGALVRDLPQCHHGPVDHDANAFTLSSLHCFRMIHEGDGTGHPTHCSDVTTWRGRWQDAAGKWHAVVSCDGHRANLDAVQPLSRDYPSERRTSEQGT
jgi:hypothetical protein